MLRLLLYGLIVMAGPVSAKEWFVSPDGDDVKGTGTQEKPFRTIMRLLNTSTGVVGAGDTVTLRGPAGRNTYSECDVRLRVPLTLRSYPGERAHIHCDIANKETVTIQIDAAASRSRLSNLEISGGYYYGVFVQTDWYKGEGEKLTGASDILLEDLDIHHTGRDGIKITPRSNRVTIRRSTIRHTGAIYPPGTPMERMNADGIDNVNGSGMVVEDSHIHDVVTNGLYFKGGASDVVVQRNRIENTGMSGILVGFDTSPEYFDLSVNPQYHESVRGIVRNNVIRNTRYAGIGLYAAKDALVANNTIIHAAQRGHAAIYFGITFQDWEADARRPPTINPTVRNNLVIQDGGSCVEIRWSHELGGLSALQGGSGLDWNGYHNTRGACRFVDRRPGSAFAGSDLAAWKRHSRADTNSISAVFEIDGTGRPVPGSPAIHSGTPLREVTDDIERRARVAPYDLGAYQSAPAQAAAADRGK